MKFRSKPVVIEAMQFTDESKDQCFHFVTCNKYASFDCDADIKKARPTLIIQTLEGDMKAQVGDWIIKGTRGEFYPCKPDVFAVKYEAVEPEQKEMVLP